MSLLASWGPAGWQFLHAVSFTYAADPGAPTDGEKREMLRFVRAAGQVLPCRTCRRHYAAFLRSRFGPNEGAPAVLCPALASRTALARFYVDMHNDVNRRLGKPQVPFAKVAPLYGGEAAGDAGGAARTCGMLLLLLVGGVVAAVLVLMRNGRTRVTQRR